MVKRTDKELVAQAVRGLAEHSKSKFVREKQPRRRRQTFIIPLEQVQDDGLKIGLSETGAHIRIKI